KSIAFLTSYFFDIYCLCSVFKEQMFASLEATSILYHADISLSTLLLKFFASRLESDFINITCSKRTCQHLIIFPRELHYIISYIFRQYVSGKFFCLSQAARLIL